MREVNRRTRRRSSSVFLLVLHVCFGASAAYAQAPTTGDAQPSEATPPPAEATPPAAPPVVPPPTEAAPARAGISGTVLDRETHEPLAGARVIIEGNGRRRVRVTDEAGHFEANLRSGVYSVRAVYPMYRSARRGTVRVDRGRRTEIEMPLRLFESDEEIIDVAIRIDRTSESTTLALREEATTVSDGLSQQEIRRGGDSNAGTAVRRIVGASVEEGSRLVVRGLGDRYSTVLLNGVPLPSTDPDRQGIQLDIIPTSVIASLTIAKSFTPDNPANWAGGLMSIESITFPEEFTLRGGFSLGYNSESTFRNRLDYSGGRLDFLGFDDGTRGLPSAFGDRLVQVSPGFTRDQIADIVRTLPVNYELTTRRALPNMSFNVSLGDSVELRNDRRFGYLLAINYQRSEQIRRGPSSRVLNANATPDNPPDYLYRLNTTTGSDELLWNAFGTATLQYSPRGNIRLVTFYTRSATDDVRYQEGQQSNDMSDVRQWQMRFTSRGVFFAQLAGEHRELNLPPHSSVQWSVYTSRTNVDQPDTRQVGYSTLTGTADPYRWSFAPNTGDRYFSTLSQVDVGGYVHMRTPLWEDGVLSYGSDMRLTSRSFELRQFQFGNRRIDPELYELPPNQLFTPENVSGDGSLLFREATRQTDGYDATQRYLAGFLMLDTAVGSRLRLIGGVRVEAFRQDLSSGLPVDPAPPATNTVVRSHRTDVSWLPSIASVIEVAEHMNLRATYAMTLARPTLREVAPLVFYDFIRRRTVSGTPGLRQTQIHNADLRWEWFPSDTEVFAVTAFYKFFINPIEQINIRSPGSDDLVYANGEDAYDVGVELEARFDFERITRALRHFHFNGNIAFIQSKVRLAPEDAAQVFDPSRGLVSQSPYVANLSLRFDHPEAGVSAGVVYNVVGPRLSYLGVRYSPDDAIPDTYELPFHSFDFIGSWEVNSHVSLRLTCRNMLNQRRRFVEKTANGNSISSSFSPGTELIVGLGLSY